MPLEETSRDAGERRPRSLTVVYSGDPALRGRVIPLGERLAIGRSTEAGVDLAIEDKLLSRQHATLTQLGTSGVYEVVDHDSSNGSFVDGLRAKRGHLTDGSILRLGVTVFELTQGEPTDEPLPPPSGLGQDRDALIGQSVAFQRAHQKLLAAAASTDPVIITGEEGTGKTVAAAFVHREQPSTGPLLVVSCGGAGQRLTEIDLVGGVSPTEPAQPIDGYLQSCDGGTLVLNEIDVLEPDAQRVLLAILRTGCYRELGTDHDRPLQARIVVCTNANLEAAVDAGAFDRELYDQLNAHHVALPPLRDRRSDIPLLAKHFMRLEEPKREFEWSATFLEKLLLYAWPMNVRELRTIARRLTMVEDDITTLRSAHLPREFRDESRIAGDDQLRASAIQVHSVPSRGELEAMLQRFEGDVQRVAEHYAKDRRHIYRWLTRHDLSANDFRR